MAAVVAVQGTIIPAVVATPSLEETTIVVSGLFCCFSSVVAITTIAVTGLFGLSCFPASVAETIMDAASFQCSGRCKNRPF